MYEMTLVQKIMVGSLVVMYLCYFVWMWRNTPSYGRKPGWMAKLRRKKSTDEDLNYTPPDGYFGQIEETRKKVAGGWFRRERS